MDAKEFFETVDIMCRQADLIDPAGDRSIDYLRSYIETAEKLDHHWPNFENMGRLCGYLWGGPGRSTATHNAIEQFVWIARQLKPAVEGEPSYNRTCLGYILIQENWIPSDLITQIDFERRLAMSSPQPNIKDSSQAPQDLESIIKRLKEKPKTVIEAMTEKRVTESAPMTREEIWTIAGYGEDESNERTFRKLNDLKLIQSSGGKGGGTYLPTEVFDAAKNVFKID